MHVSASLVAKPYFMIGRRWRFDVTDQEWLDWVEDEVEIETEKPRRVWKPLMPVVWASGGFLFALLWRFV